MRVSIDPLWRDPDFGRLWAATAVSQVGSFVTRTALPFTAILVLGAGAAEVAVLRAAELVAALTFGLFVGAWVDRLRRRPVMVWADAGRAILLVSVPTAYVLGWLSVTQLVVVAFLGAILTTFFDTADRAFLPLVARRDRLVRANATLTASSSAAEFVGFGLGGWLIQVLTAPVALLLDALSYVLSAVLLVGIRTAEPPPRPREDRAPVLVEIAEGLRRTLGDPVLRPLALADAVVAGSWGVFGALILLYATELGFPPAVIGLLAAIGGASALVGAVVADRGARRVGVGRFLSGSMLVAAIGAVFIPLAPDGGLLGFSCLLAQQLVMDGALTAFDVVAVSVRQGTVEDAALGRVSASFRVLAMGAMLVGTVVAGVVGEVVGLRPALALAAGAAFLAPLIVRTSAAHRLGDLPVGLTATGGPVEAGVEVPLDE